MKTKTQDVLTLIRLLRELMKEDTKTLTAITCDEAELRKGGTSLPTVRLLAHELIGVAQKALDALDAEGREENMTKEDYKLISLISHISNSEFPLIDFANDLDILYRKGRLQGFDYEAMQEDLVKIAKLFKYYYDEATKKEAD